MKEQKNSIGVRKGNKPHDFSHEARAFNVPEGSKVKFKLRIGFQSSFLFPCFNWVMLLGLHLLFVTNCSVSYKSLNSLGCFDAV